jgi:mono/diheme cytochrome c family protein
MSIKIWVQMVLTAMLVGGCDQPKKTAPASQDESLEVSVAAGAKLFLRNGCAVCHGETGKGDGKIAHTLKKPPRDLHDLVSYQRGPALDQIEETIRQGIGIGEGSMPGYPHIKPEDRRRMAHFIRSLQGTD